MTTARKRKAWGGRANPERWSYPRLAEHLEVSKRTLIRWVVAGMIAPPQMHGHQAFWEGEALALAKQGRKIPGTYSYASPERERKRMGSIRRKQEIQAQGKRLRKARQRKASQEVTVQS